MNNTIILNFPYSIKQRLALKWNFNLKLFWLVISVFFAMSLILYIFQINELAQKVYLTNQYEGVIADLSEENQIKEFKLSKFNSLDELETIVMEMDFEAVGKVHYIRVLEETMVTK